MKTKTNFGVFGKKTHKISVAEIILLIVMSPILIVTLPIAICYYYAAKARIKRERSENI